MALIRQETLVKIFKMLKKFYTNKLNFQSSYNNNMLNDKSNKHTINNKKSFLNQHQNMLLNSFYIFIYPIELYILYK